MLLQSLRLAWPIFSQGWPLFYFCHLWATQLLIHMQMKLAPSLARVTASARCSAHSTRLCWHLSVTFFSAAAQTLCRGERQREKKIGREADKKKPGLVLLLLNCVSVWSSLKQGAGRVAALQRERAVRVSALRRARRIRGGGRGSERVACCRGLSPPSGWGVALGDRKRKACNETWALSGVCCRRFTRASQVSPQQKGTLDTSSSPIRARCTTWTTQVITQPAVSAPHEEARFLSLLFFFFCSSLWICSYFSAVSCASLALCSCLSLTLAYSQLFALSCSPILCE